MFVYLFKHFCLFLSSLFVWVWSNKILVLTFYAIKDLAVADYSIELVWPFNLCLTYTTFISLFPNLDFNVTYMICFIHLFYFYCSHSAIKTLFDLTHWLVSHEGTLIQCKYIQFTKDLPKGGRSFMFDSSSTCCPRN